MALQTISSTQNKLIKEVCSLSSKKFRDEAGLMLVEGINLLRDIPSEVRIRHLFVTEAREGELTLFEGKNVDNIYLVSDAVMCKLADTVSPYGIAAVCEISKPIFATPKGNALLLDGVSDPGNIGTILRTAAACGFEDIYLLGCADVYSPKVVRASLGAVFKLKLHEICLEQAITLALSQESAVLDMGGKNILCHDIPTPVLLIAGNEAHGVRCELKKAAKHTLSLPMKNGMESLNVAVATAVAMYQTMKI